MLAERLIKSPYQEKGISPNDLILADSRVKNYGEVFTPENTVSDMLDLLSDKYGMEQGLNTGVLPIETTVLEPSCGSGNILVQVLKRKLKSAKTSTDILRAVSSIYGVDIKDDNVLECRLRLLKIVELFYESLTGVAVSEEFLKIVADILEDNIVLGNTVYKGLQKKDYNKNGDVYNLDKPIEFHGGLVELTNSGDLKVSPLVTDKDLYERLYFYEWTWKEGVLEPVSKIKSYFDEDLEVKSEPVLKSQSDLFSSFDTMFGL